MAELAPSAPVTESPTPAHSLEPETTAPTTETSSSPAAAAESPKDVEVNMASTSSVPPSPAQPDIPASESHEIMSEGHSDWEKVEKPLQSPPKAKGMMKVGVKKEENKEAGFKGKVGEVKRVLKTGMFGKSHIPLVSYSSIMV